MAWNDTQKIIDEAFKVLDGAAKKGNCPELWDARPPRLSPAERGDGGQGKSSGEDSENPCRKTTLNIELNL